MPVRKSVGSNPTGVIIFCRIRFAIYECILNKIEVSSIGFVLINNIRILNFIRVSQFFMHNDYDDLI